MKQTDKQKQPIFQFILTIAILFGDVEPLIVDISVSVVLVVLIQIHIAWLLCQTSA